jgi:hypothetical protein
MSEIQPEVGGAEAGWPEGEPDLANVPGGYSDENLRAAWDGTPELAEAASDAHVCGFSDPNPVCCAGLEREPDGNELEARQAELEAEAAEWQEREADEAAEVIETGHAATGRAIPDAGWELEAGY